ncbi:hypothetical protein BDR26DRAFT_852790 [Obelidium mucronatum]|nr:hypothetical protein BDR26DRAFT_852790 [Obelidium mucronatum]
MRERRKILIQSLETDLRVAQTQLESQAQRIALLERENTSLKGKLVDSSVMDSQYEVDAVEPCRQCSNAIFSLQQQNKLLQSQLALIHSENTNIEAAPLQSNSSPEASSQLASPSASTQDALIPSSESLFGPLNLYPYRDQLALIPSVGLENANEFVEIIVTLSKSTSMREIRLNMMKVLLERAQLLDLLYRGNHQSSNAPHAVRMCLLFV